MMAIEDLADLVLHDVISRLDATGAATLSFVSRRLRDCASADDIWRVFCLRDFGLAAMEDPAGNPTRSFKDTYRIWRESFAMYPCPLVKRVRQCWMVIKTWLAVNFVEAAKTLLDGASEAELDELEVKLRLKLPLTTRLLYRFCAGQQLPKPNFEETYHSGTLGVIGGYSFYTQIANVYLIPPALIIKRAKIFRQHISSVKLPKHYMPIAVCPYGSKLFYLNCDDSQLYVGTKNLVRDGELLPCVPDELLIPAQSINDCKQQDGMLLWLEEHGRRLENGNVRIRSEGDYRMISLFPEVKPLCTTAVTNGVQVRASAVLVPECSDLSGDYEHYFYAYSIRMCLLPQFHSTDLRYFDGCQLYSRHWIIREKDTIVEEVGGEGVIGLQPVLNPDGKEFVYESCTPLSSSPGSIEGSFTFVPGRLSSPKGDPFDVEVARVPLERPEYIF